MVTTVAGGAGSTASGYIDGVGTVAMFYNPSGITIDANSYFWVADTYNHLIRMLAPTGIMEY